MENNIGYSRYDGHDQYGANTFDGSQAAHGDVSSHQDNQVDDTQSTQGPHGTQAGGTTPFLGVVGLENGIGVGPIGAAVSGIDVGGVAMDNDGVTAVVSTVVGTSEIDANSDAGVGSNVSAEQQQQGEFDSPSGAFANVGQGLEGKCKNLMMQYWQDTINSIERDEYDFKSHQLPLARIKKVMKTDEEVKMISAEAPILFAKGCDIFITELTMRAWIHAEENKRRTLQKSDIAAALQKSDMFDFLIDIVPREEEKPKKKHSHHQKQNKKHDQVSDGSVGPLTTSIDSPVSGQQIQQAQQVQQAQQAQYQQLYQQQYLDQVYQQQQRQQQQLQQQQQQSQSQPPESQPQSQPHPQQYMYSGSQSVQQQGQPQVHPGLGQQDPSMSQIKQDEDKFNLSNGYSF
ncbi:hypothetical protein FOA43_001288 [Brettanomyces nanus]|uniref:Core Histone H2A/H2B/H3 domain-containing protein n=1 Tax=Eeniella nana TaxID=13502 RepID=A0A875S1J4_EENNA|nr:uncharacterized protein FOA43_001288 [Brettanomyces nanus]QPG73972.1 hypothetical protein FOA43_001288 [Brettanomyces nanus]